MLLCIISSKNNFFTVCFLKFILLKIKKIDKIRDEIKINSEIANVF